MLEAFTLKLHQQISSLEKQLASANDVEKRRIESMITFRKSPEALKGYQSLAGCHASDFIERACAYRKQVVMACEEIPPQKLAGGLLEKIAAKYRPVALLYRFVSTTAKTAKTSMATEGTKGVLGGYITDEFYQSPKLFPEFGISEKDLSFFEKLKRRSAGTMEMRNRYRRVMDLSLSKNRIAYFKSIKGQGAGTAQNPIFIASIGGGTGSVEMDIQQQLRENHNIYSRIVIFDVVDQNRINGSFFAKMRGADICWVIQTLGANDLLTQLRNGSFDSFLRTPLRGVDAHGNFTEIAADGHGLAHHLVMSGLWAKFCDEDVLSFMAISNRMMHSGAHAVVTLSWDKYHDKQSHEKVIPSMRVIDHLGHDKDGVWYRNIESLRKSRLLDKGGFLLANKLDGPILPAIAIAPIHPNVA